MFKYSWIYLLFIMEEKELNETANIEQIIEIYDNGHESVFYPDTHMTILKLDFKTLLDLLSHETYYDEVKQMKEKYSEGK